jgi:hypothetical protein
MDTRGKCWRKSAFSYEAQMIICILIIYPLVVSAVHVMNEYFFSFFSRASLGGIVKRLVVFRFFLFHMFYELTMIELLRAREMFT